MDILDRIAQGYLGELGEKVQQDSRKRITWICDHVSGERILDIGCSQGICELLLARKGHIVVGVDIADESINYARKLIQNEPDNIKNNITFLCKDYLKEPCFDKKFDTIILTEVLEHLEFPDLMLEKAMKDLSDDGEVIVTVPFGINDFPDHKHTFYMFDILNMLSNYLKVEKIEFMGAWIGFYGKRTQNPYKLEQIDKFLLRQEEQAFFSIERPLRDQIIKLNELYKVLNEKYKKAEENYATMKDWFSSKQLQNENLQKKINALEQEKKEKEKKINLLEQEQTNREKKINLLEQEKKDKQEQIQEKDIYISEIKKLLKKSYNELEEDSQLLETLKRQLQQTNAKLQLANVKNKEYETKLNKVYGTWYGRIALKIYKVLKRMKGIFR